MDRRIFYPAEVPRSIDLLTSERDTMSAIGVMLQALLGSGTFVDGLACTPVTGSLAIQIGPGSIYSLAGVDASPYGALAADTIDQIVQQGLAWGQTPIPLTAPATAGQSVVYLIEAQFEQVDSGATALQFYQSANPTQALQGYPYNTVRKGVCALQAKAGTPAATGSQAAPTADAGWSPLWTVTVAHGQTTVSTGNIALASAAPFVTMKLGGAFTPYYGNPNGHVPGTAGTAGLVFPSVVFDLQNNIWWVCTTSGNAGAAVWTEVGSSLAWPFYAGVSTGTANAQVVTIPASVQNFSAGDSFWFTVGAGLTNTGPLNITLPAQGSFAGGTYPARKDGPTGPIALAGGEVVAGNTPVMKFDGTYVHLGATELGTAALANASSNTGVVAAVQGATTSGNLAVFADAAGTVKNGPALSSNQNTVAAVQGAGGITPGEVMVAIDANGTLGASGTNITTLNFTVLTVANTGTTIQPGNYAVDTTGGPVTLDLSATLGGVYTFSDPKNSWGTNAMTLNGNGHNIGTAANNAATFVADVSDQTFLLLGEGTIWGAF